MLPLKGSILITGSNGGLGSGIVSRILSETSYFNPKEYYGLYTVRKEATASAVRGVLEKGASTEHPHELVEIDLGRLSTVRKAAEDINKRVANGSIPPIRALILNAGYQEHLSQAFSDDGFDMSFQANFLSHFLLTLLLLRSVDKEHGRIVVVGSWSHDPHDSRNVQGPTRLTFSEERHKILFHGTEGWAKGIWSSEVTEPGDPNNGYRRYGAGKLAEVMMVHELQKRLNLDPELSKISVVGVDPGAMPTDIVRRGNWILRVLIAKILGPPILYISSYFNPKGDFRTTWVSGGDVLRAAFDTQEVGEYPKAMYFNGSVVANTSAEAKDPEKGKQLWTGSLEYAQIKEGDTVLVNWR